MSLEKSAGASIVLIFDVVNNMAFMERAAPLIRPRVVLQ